MEATAGEDPYKRMPQFSRCALEKVKEERPKEETVLPSGAAAESIGSSGELCGGSTLVVIMDPFERDFSKQPALIMQMHPKKHIANAVIEALKVPNAMLEGNQQIFVTAFCQLAAVGVMSSGSVSSWVLTLFFIAAVTGFLGCLWAMYLQKNQTYTKWLFKIGSVASTCAIIVALSLNFANDKNSIAVFTVVTLACIVSGAMIIRN